MKRGSSAPLFSRTDLEQFFANGLDTYVPHLAIDCAIFGFHGVDLRVLLLKWKGMRMWSLPGGYVRNDTSLDAAAVQILRQRTGLDRIHLRQFHAFGGLNRKEASLRAFYRKMGITVPADAWPLRRIISIGYYALVDYAQVEPSVDAMSDSCNWYPVANRPVLAFDHEHILQSAHQALRQSMDRPAAAAALLPETFTMPELQRLHEAVLGTPLDRRNFQKRMLDRGGLVRIASGRSTKTPRLPYRYRFVASETDPR